jgi:hypothetical protein
MQFNSYTSDHRWYLLMVLEAKVFMALCDKLRLPSVAQAVLVAVPCLLPTSFFEGGEYAFDFCEGGSTTPLALQFVLSWIFRNWGTGCAMYWRWVHWYVVFYVWCFYGIRPLLATRWAPKLAPKGPVGAAVAFTLSMSIGLAMGMFHYPNTVLENGTGIQWAWLEMGANMVQPSLFIMSMLHVPVDMSWWGNTTLGCYIFHFYFKSHATILIEQTCTWLAAVNLAGLPQFFAVLGGCVTFTTFAGPLGHYLLISPYILWVRVSRSGWSVRSLTKRFRAAALATAASGSLVTPEKAVPSPPNEALMEKCESDTSVDSSSESEAGIP